MDSEANKEQLNAFVAMGTGSNVLANLLATTTETCGKQIQAREINPNIATHRVMVKG